MNPLRPAIFLACVASLACGTAGAKGKIGFAYVSGTGCQFGCDIGLPVAKGSVETVLLFGPPQTFEVVSSAPTVLSATRTDTPNWAGAATVTVTALEAGTAELQVNDATGVLVDEIAVSVAAPASVRLGEELPSGSLQTSGVALSLDGGIVTFEARALTARGAALQCSTGWSYSFAGGAALAPATLEGSSSDSIPVAPAATGASTVSAHLGTLTGSLAVTVTP